MKTKLHFFLLPALVALAFPGVGGRLYVETLAETIEEGYNVPKIVDFACGEYHNLAIDSNGNLWEWGCKTGSQSSPQQIMAGTKFIKVSAGLDYSLAVDEDGNVFSWSTYDTPEIIDSGKNSVGVVGPDKTCLRNDSGVPISYQPFVDNTNAKLPYLFIDNEDYLDAAGRTVDIGRKYSNWYTYYKFAPGAASIAGKRFYINDGYSFYSYCVVGSPKGTNGFKVEYYYVQWGSFKYSPNVAQESGIDKRFGPSLWPAWNLSNFIYEGSDEFLGFAITKKFADVTVFGLTKEGILCSFGFNEENNLLGSQSTTATLGEVDELVEVDIPAKVKQVDAGANHAMALTEDGHLYSWGSNDKGQLGLGDTTNRNLPTLVPFFSTNAQYSFAATKGETHKGTFALDGMNSYSAVVDPKQGDLTLNSSTGEFTYTPSENANGNDYFEVEVSDGVNPKTYIVNVTIDHKPVWQTFKTSFVLKPGESIDGSVSASDEDGNDLKYSIVEYPLQGEVAIDEDSGEFTYTADEDGAGDDSFKVAVTDGYSTIEKTISVHVETLIVVDDVYERNFDTTSSPAHFDSQLSATDDDGDALSWSVTAQPSLGTLILDSTTGEYSYDADSGKTGDDTFTIQVTDGVTPIEKEYTIHLYSIADGGTSLVNSITTGTPLEGQVLTNAENTDVSYSVKTQGQFGNVTINSETGEYTYQPQENTHGQDSFVITVDHTYGNYDVEIFVYQNSIPNDSLVETNIVVKENGSFSGSAACTDIDLSDTLTYSIKEEPKKGEVVLNASTGEYTYKPSDDVAGNDSFSVRVSDGINEITITINVHIESVIQTDTEVSVVASQNTSIKGIIQATDKDGDEVSYSLKVAANHGTSSVASDGTYEYMPDTDFYGDDAFVIAVSDGVEPVDVTINVHVNRKPIAAEEEMSLVANGAPVDGAVSATDPDGDALVYSVSVQPKQGIVTINSEDGSFTYTPNEGAAGDDYFYIKADDGVDYALVKVNVHNETELEIDLSKTDLSANQGKVLNGAVIATDADGDSLSYRVVSKPTKGTLTLDSSTGKWSYSCNDDAVGEDSFEIGVTDGVKEKTITYNLKINIPPKLSSDSKLSFVVDQGKTYVGSIKGEDAEGDVLSYLVVIQGNKGAVTIDSGTGQYRYVPNQGAAGDDKFVLGISDGIFTTEVTISVHIETDIVIGQPTLDVVVKKGEKIEGTIDATDADDDPLTYSVSEAPTKGTATVSSEGKWSYVANKEGAGKDSFVVKVTDGTHSKFVTVNVRVSTSPSFSDKSQTIAAIEKGETKGKVTAVDLDGDEVTYSVSTKPSNGSVIVDPKTGDYTYQNNKKSTFDSFVLKASDKEGNEALITINVEINSAPSVPEQTPTYFVGQGGNVSGKIEVSDVEGDELTFELVTQPAYGTVELDKRTGTFNYRARLLGTSSGDSFVVEVGDGVNKVRVVVEVSIDPTGAFAGFIAGGTVAYVGAIVAAVIIIRRLKKKGA